MNKRTFSPPVPVVGQFLDSTENRETNLAIEYSQLLYFLFLFFSLYLVIPLVDVPLLGLSLSAPIFFLVAIQVLLRPIHPWFGAYRRWILIAALIWLGIVFSVILNGLFSGGSRIDRDSLISLVQFAYWLLSFVVTLYLVSSQKNLAERLVRVIAIGIAILGVLRLGEAIVNGAIGAWIPLKIMSQNSYAIQFSMFFPILHSFAYWGGRRKLAIFATIMLLATILINGSRSSWIAVFISTIIFIWMYLRTQRRYTRIMVTLLVLTMMSSLIVLFAPQVVLSAFEQRISTIQRLDEDKSYSIRQLMIQKGIRLFRSSPWIGIGVSRWRKESVALELPSILGYASLSYFDNKSSHNSYVSYLAENGIVGTIPLALLLLTLVIRGYRSASNLSKLGQTWALGVYAGFIGMSIHLWALSGLTSTSTWFVYGLVSAIIVLDQRSKELNKDKTSYATRFSLSRSRHF